ncbi:uncharacterized protein N7483_001794 [Penicillium malachiteum]|uniref:uncharacterized protein n=1 Tax=Penicillium malachiteum TaxID=1324776 RepID=UPI0025469315|nr:uncharacterized protein N7483_001794 [Penicillium malachiteum]KAJ5736669.1 hypothetical protein N7483_001794 [Penicillium malachiteum]
MSSSILHQCPFCGHVSDISLSLPSFIENPHCIQCGLSVSESNGKIQDELAALFDQHMAIESRPEPQLPTPTYSISQHYHHSTHVVSTPKAPVQAPPTPSPIDTLWQHGIDPSTLGPRQLDLFIHADMEQQQRLVQTWQVYARSSGTLVDSSEPRTVDMEMSMDDGKAEAEPYMAAGYDNSPRTEPSTGQQYSGATDPVYKGHHWWEMAQNGPMESQYGAFQERNRCDMGGMAHPSLFH